MIFIICLGWRRSGFTRGPTPPLTSSILRETWKRLTRLSRRMCNQVSWVPQSPSFHLCVSHSLSRVTPATQTFCSSHKAWLTCHPRARLVIGVINAITCVVNTGLLPVFFVDSDSPCLDLLFPYVPNLAKRLCI